MRQTSFQFFKDYKKEFGGSLLVGKRKSRRPLSVGAPIHLILKSDQKGVFNPCSRSLEKHVRNTAQKFNVRVYDLALNWSHIHLLIRIKDRRDYVKFIRALSSMIAQSVNRIQPGVRKLFALRPFTRILSWGRDFENAFHYVKQNQLEALGFACRKKIQSRSVKGKPQNKNRFCSQRETVPKVLLS